ncbi:hypothetical protein L9F63_021381, partial [Diploptera punctata]
NYRNMSLKCTAVNVLMALVTIGFCLKTHGISLEEEEEEYQLLPGIGYYKLYGKYMSWFDAQNTCLEEGAELVLINTEEEAEALIKLIPDDWPYDNVLAGFHDQFIEGVFVTTTGVNLKDVTSYSSFPNDTRNNEDRNCGAVNMKTGLLDTVSCSASEYYFICELQLWADYELYKGVGYYTLHTEGKTWVEAKKTCEKEGAHLTIINSESESTVIANMFDRHTNIPNVQDDSIALIGFSMVYDTRDISNSSKKFVTIQGQSINSTGFHAWTKGQPDPKTLNFCGATTRNGNLTLTDCNTRYAFFCEHELYY